MIQGKINNKISDVTLLVAVSLPQYDYFDILPLSLTHQLLSKNIMISRAQITRKNDSIKN